MPLQKIQFKPGVQRENTNYTGEGGWFDCDKVRFRSGSPQKIGGWVRQGNNTYQGVCRNLINWSSLSGEVLIGIGTHLRYYVDYGTTIYNITPLRDSPNTLTLGTNPFSTTSGSTIVVVTATAHSVNTGDFVVFSGATATGGVSADDLNRTVGFQVTYLDANSFSIEVTDAATSTATGGGSSVEAEFELEVGLPVYSVGTGWGAPIWNAPVLTSGLSTTLTGTSPQLLNASDTTINVTSTTGFPAAGTILIDAELITYTGVTSTSFTGCTRGTSETTAAVHAQRMTAPSTYAPIYVYSVTSLAGTTGWGVGASNSFGVGQQLRLWSSDNYGQDLVIAPRGGRIYYWTKNTSTFARAVPLAEYGGGSYPYVPTQTNAVLISDVYRFVVCLGANPYTPGVPGSTFDPMLVRWSGQEDPTLWIPAITNQSGAQRLSNGSYIVTGAKMKQETLIWTDSALYSMQYVGPPYVFGFTLQMGNLSIMGPNAVATVNNTVYWMGLDKFYAYNGRVETLPCTVRQYIFNDLAVSQAYQTFAGTNEGYTEVWWFYVSNAEVDAAASQGRDPTVDKYVVYNHLDNIWYYGTLSRTAWLDSPLQRGPLAAIGDTDAGWLLTHEQGVDDLSTDTARPITAYIQSSDFDISDGNQYMFVWRMLPDVSFDGSAVDHPSVDISLYPRQNSGSTYGTAGTNEVLSTQNYTNVKTYNVQQFTQQVYVRVRGRQMAFRIESSSLGTNWQLGATRIDARSDGRKS